MVNMDFEEAVGFLDSFGLKMEGFNLDAIRELAKISGLETEKLKVIHVAGTNGKGSTTAFISSILKEAGYLIGSYYSPHIFSIRERVRINGKLIAEEDFAKAVGFFVPFLEEMKGKPTYFELLTAVAIKYFLDGKVDFAVLETGMGGRLDATNIFESMVSAITSLDLEHTQYLGKAIDEIASEKAGIIKQDSFVVFSKENKGRRIIEKIAKTKNAKVVIPEYELKKVSAKGNLFGLLKPARIKKLETSLLGEKQAENAALAAAAALCLREKGYAINESAIRKGLKKAFIEGRLQVIGRKPLVTADVAHNPAAMEALMQAVKIFKFEKLIVVFSCLADKGIREIMGKINADLLVVCQLKNARAAGIGSLAGYCPENSVVICGAKKAFEEAENFASEKDLVLVCGSHYLIQEVFG